MENKTKINMNLDFTISKITGLVVILGGLALGFYLHSETVAISLISVGAGMITVKTIVQNNKS